MMTSQFEHSTIHSLPTTVHFDLFEDVPGVRGHPAWPPAPARCGPPRGEVDVPGPGDPPASSFSVPHPPPPHSTGSNQVRSCCGWRVVERVGGWYEVSDSRACEPNGVLHSRRDLYFTY